MRVRIFDSLTRTDAPKEGAPKRRKAAGRLGLRSFRAAAGAGFISTNVGKLYRLAGADAFEEGAPKRRKAAGRLDFCTFPVTI
jgi:hypothetical protein